MAVTDVSEDFKGRKSGTDAKGVRKATRVYRVVCSDFRDGPHAAERASGIPVRGNVYNDGISSDAKLRVETVDASPQDDDPLIHLVTVNYVSLPDPEGSLPENPMDRPAKFKWGFVQSTEGKYRDAD